MSYHVIKDREYIRKRTTICPERGCWLWTGAKTPAGYGHCTDGRGGFVRVHRLSWDLFVGPIPSGKSVLHRCDIRNCVNPLHLFLGTQTDNNQDMKEKGRARGKREQRGETNSYSKLTESDIKNIRVSGQKGTALALHFGVSKSNISAIRRRRSWKHVPEALGSF